MPVKANGSNSDNKSIFANAEEEEGRKRMGGRGEEWDGDGKGAAVGSAGHGQKKGQDRALRWQRHYTCFHPHSLDKPQSTRL